MFAVKGKDRTPWTAAWEPSFGADWHGWWQTGTTAVAAGSSVYGVSRSADHLDIFAVSPDTGTYTAAWEPSFGATWRGWWSVGPLGQAGDWREWKADIDFNNGVTVQGWSKLRVSAGGAYVFSGHFHNSGTLNYDASIAWVLKSSDGKAVAFTKKGSTSGLLGSGSRNYDWSVAGTDPELAKNFAKIVDGGTVQWKAKSSLDVKALLGQILVGLAIVAETLHVVAE